MRMGTIGLLVLETGGYLLTISEYLYTEVQQFFLTIKSLLLLVNLNHMI
jgi:hypothetical protein